LSKSRRERDSRTEGERERGREGDRGVERAKKGKNDTKAPSVDKGKDKRIL